MFTGIILHHGYIVKIISKSDSMELIIKSDLLHEDVKIGDSIAINGVCLTVTKFDESMCYFDVMNETFNSTTLSKVQINEIVNLEPALRINDRIGGHLLSGHVDGIGTITSISPSTNSYNINIEMNKQLIKHIVHKGSIAIDGISLTVFNVDEASINVSIIPHTWNNTNLKFKKISDSVNIENDLIAKYVANFVKHNKNLDCLK